MRFMRLPEVMERVGLRRSTLYLYIAEGRFPKQVKLGQRSVAWNSDDIDNWMKERLEQSESM